MGSLLHCPLSCPLFHIGSSWLPTELSTVSLYWSSGQPNLHGKIPMGSPRAANSAAHWAAHFLIFGSSGLPTELPTELPTDSIYGSSRQPNLHGKIPMGRPRAAHSVAHVQPMGSEVGSSPVFSVWAITTPKSTSIHLYTCIKQGLLKHTQVPYDLSDEDPREFQDVIRTS